MLRFLWRRDGGDTVSEMARLEQPHSVGELLAATTQIYGERIRAVAGLGAVTGFAFLLSTVVPEPGRTAIVVAALAFPYAAAVRIVGGDRFGEAWAQVVVRLPVLAVLAVVTVLPFAVIANHLLLFLLAAVWLGAAGFAIPAAMIERDADRGWFWRLHHALGRTLALARVDFAHAVGGAAVFVLVYLVFGTLLFRLLIGFAENDATVAATLVHAVLAPFAFVGLAVLYFDQNARALSSRRQSRRGGRADADVHHHVEPERAGAPDAPREPGAASRGEP